MKFLLGILLAIFILLEGTVTTLPLVLVFLLCITILKRDGVIFPIAFVAGLLLDLLTVQTVGEKSIFLIVFVFLVLLYQRKYEINSYPFVVFAAFFGSLGFGLLFAIGNVFGQALLSALVASILFMIL